MFGLFTRNRNKRTRSDEENPVIEEQPIPAPTTLSEYQERFSEPAYATKLHEGLNQVYPVTYTSSGAAPHFYSNVPSSSYLPPASIQDVSVSETTLSKPDILTLDIMCKMIQIPAPNTSTSPSVRALTEVVGPLAGIAAYMSVTERVGSLGALKSAAKLVTSKGLQSALRGSLSAFQTNPIVAHLIENGPGYASNMWSAYQGQKLVRSVASAVTQPPTLLSACQQSFKNLCKREGISCKEVYCRAAYVAYYKRQRQRIDLDVYVSLPQAFIEQFTRMEHEIRPKVRSFVALVPENVAEEDAVRQLNVLVDNLVIEHFKGDLDEWLRFIKLKPNLANEVGLIASLLFYFSRDSTWRQVVTSIVRRLCLGLHTEVYGEDPPATSTDMIVHQPPARVPDDAPMTVFEDAVRSIIIIMSCNADDTAFQTTIGSALTSMHAQVHKIDRVARLVHRDLIVGLESGRVKRLRARV